MGISLNPSTILNGSGIDVSSLVAQIISEQSGQTSIWQQENTNLSTEDGLLLGLENNLTALQTSMQALSSPTGAMVAQAATSSDTSVLTATANSTAVNGTHQVVVTNLATAGILYSQPISGGAGVSILPSGATSGTLALKVGSTTHNITITPGSNDTLTKLAGYINTQSAANSWGVTASIASDSSGARLELQSQNTGTSGALSIATNTTTGTTLDTADMSSADATILPSGSAGDFELQIGGSSGTTADFQITAGTNDTLNTLANYIDTQSQANNWGLSASVVQDSGGYHLAITSSASGSAGAITIANNTTSLTAANPATNLQFLAAQGGTNASVIVDGVTFTSATNTVTGAIQGVTLNLLNQSADNTPLTLTVGPDVDQISAAVNNFVSAYNTVISTINTQYNVDPTGTVAPSALLGDSSLQTVQAILLQDAGFSMPLTDSNGNTTNSGYVNLASLGINMNNDGTLTVGSTPSYQNTSGQTVSGQTFEQIVAANPAAVQNFFQNATNGFATNFQTSINSLTDATSGPFNVAVAQNQAEQADLNTTITNFQTQLTQEQTALTQEYDSVNASLEAYPLLLQSVTENASHAGFQ